MMMMMMMMRRRRRRRRRKRRRRRRKNRSIAAAWRGIFEPLHEQAIVRVLDVASMLLVHVVDNACTDVFEAVGASVPLHRAKNHGLLAIAPPLQQRCVLIRGGS